MKTEEINAVRTVLQKFQEGYLHRDLNRIDEMMDLFVDDPDLEVIGTGATDPGKGEWCLGPQAVRELIESDYKYWGDLSIDVANARIHVFSETAWLAASATIQEHLPHEKLMSSFIDYVPELLQEDSDQQTRIFNMLRIASNMFYQSSIGDFYLWPLRFTANLVKRNGSWLFHQMQFSYPTSTYPDVRRPLKKD